MSQVNTLPAHCCAPASRKVSFSVGGIFSMIALWRSRRQLAALDADQLADIGLSPRKAAAEAARAPWDVPAHWRN